MPLFQHRDGYLCTGHWWVNSQEKVIVLTVCGDDVSHPVGVEFKAKKKILKS